MDKRYEILDKTLNYKGHILHRVRRVSDCLLGGWIESEDNLSQEGSCFVFGEAKVYGGARVFGNAEVFGNAKVYDLAKVHGNAKVYGASMVYRKAEVYDNAHIFGNAEVYGLSTVYGDAKVYGGAEIYDSAQVFGFADIHEYAKVYNSAKAFGNTELRGRSKLNGRTQACTNTDKDESIDVCGELKYSTEEIVNHINKLKNERDDFLRALATIQNFIYSDEYIGEHEINKFIETCEWSDRPSIVLLLNAYREANRRYTEYISATWVNTNGVGGQSYNV